MEGEEGGAANDADVNGMGDGSTMAPLTSTIVQGDSARYNVGASSANGNKRTKKRKKNSHVKDPEEATAYLNNWKLSKGGKNSDVGSVGGSGDWKFNKNTQSWLIRHMYECEKVSKSTFSILLDYLEGLEGNITKERIRTEATRRARRYKDHCHSNTQQCSEKNEESADNHNPPDAGKKDDKIVSRKSDGDKKEMEEEEEEESRWIKLSDNEKRKEYKRARKILDLLKA